MMIYRPFHDDLPTLFLYVPVDKHPSSRRPRGYGKVVPYRPAAPLTGFSAGVAARLQFTGAENP